MSSELPEYFPILQMSFEQPVQKTFHKKNDIFMAIPHGIPCFLWCTTNLSTNTAVCVVISDNKYIFHFDISFRMEFIEGQGTILFATQFAISSLPYVQFFAIDNVYYYRDQNVTDMTWGDKLACMKDILSCSLFENNDNIIVGLPFISYTKKHLQQSLKNCPYTIEKYIYRNFYQSNISYVERNERQQKTFRIKASPLYDIYYLYEMDDVYCRQMNPKILNIPDYKTSVMMNTLFRNIKENMNIDLLEESDDEEEFQQKNTNTYTDLEKVVEMECYYDDMIDKWMLNK